MKMEREPFDPRIFLTYANAHIEQGLGGILQEMKKSKCLDKYQEYFDLPSYIDVLIKTNKTDYPLENKERLEKDILNYLADFYIHRREYSKYRNAEIQRFAIEVLSQAKRTGCDYESGNIKMSCSWRQFRQEIFDTQFLKCYECDHKYFEYLLTELSKGKEYSEIKYLDVIIIDYRPLNWNTQFRIVPDDKPPFKEKIGLIHNDFLSERGERNYSIPNIFHGMVTDSLVNFLINDDRRKLKICEHCGNFYIKRRLNFTQKYCSEKCRNAKNRWSNEKIKKTMKDRRTKEKSKKEESIKNAQIQRFIKAGYSHKEAEREWLKVREEIMRSPKDFELVKRDKPVKRHTSRLT